MPTNEVYRFWSIEQPEIACTSPAVPAVGGPVRLGNLTGVALTREGEGGNSAGHCTVDFGISVWDLPVTDSVGGGIAVGDTLFLIDGAPATVKNDSSGVYFGIALEPVGAGLTATIRVLHDFGVGAGTVGPGTIATAHLANGILSADAAGRGKVAANFFDAATVLAKFAVNSLTNANLDAIIAANGFAADADSRGKFADGIWTGAKLATGFLKVNLAAGTGIGVNVNLAAMAAGDEIVSVLSFTTAAAIASVADRTAEYAAGAGVLTKAAGTDETNNQLVIIWIDKT